MSRNNRLLLAVLASLFSAHALAQTSITHVGLLEIDYSRARQSGVQETDTATVLATVYLEEVSHGDVPHNQAAFLERASSLTLSWSDLRVDFGSSGDVGGDVAFVDFQYIMASHWIVGGSRGQGIPVARDAGTLALRAGRKKQLRFSRSRI